MRRIGGATGSTRSVLTRSRTPIRVAIAVALMVGTGAAVAPATSAAAPGTGPSWSVTPSPSPPGPPIGDLGGVSCASATDCVAVGANELGPMAEHWNGTGWKIVGVPAPGGQAIAELDAVSCPSASECTAVGDSETDTETTFADKSLIEQWNGTAWSIVPSPNPTGPDDNAQLSGVSCASTTNCFAVGNATNSSDSLFTAKTLVEHWDGTTWSIVASPNPVGALDSELIGVSCTSTTNCFAAGDWAGASSAGTLIEQWDGTSWTISPSAPPIGPSAAPSTRVAAGTASPVTSSGARARALLSEAATLQAGSPAAIARAALVPSGSASARRASSAGARADGASFGTIPGLSAVSCTSPTSCIAVGDSDTGALTEQWNGTAWAMIAMPPLQNTDGGELFGISCPKSTDCTAVGAYSTGADPFAPSHTLAEHWNGTSWSVELLGLGTVFSEFDAVSCTNSHTCAAVGDSAFVQQWDGARWSIAPFASETSQSSLVDVACTSATSCLAVGHAVTSTRVKTLVEKFDGSVWSVLPSPNPGEADASLFSVSCPSATNCFAVGQYVRGETGRPLVEHWNGTTWSIVLAPSPPRSELAEFTDVSCPSAVSCTAVGLSFGPNAITALAEYWDGTRWVIEPTDTRGADLSELIGVSCVAPSDCTAVGGAATFTATDVTSTALVEHWNGLSWTAVPNSAPGDEAELAAVSCVATDDCNAIGAVQSTLFTTRPMAEHWNGVEWTVAAVPEPPHAQQSTLESLACHSEISCYAVGGYSTATAGRTLVDHWNGSAWTNVASASPTTPPDAVSLNGVSYPTPSTCIAVGGYSTPFGIFTLAERAG
jgi:hypothetical protein